MDAGGNFVVSYTREVVPSVVNGVVRDVLARRYDSSGNAIDFNDAEMTAALSDSPFRAEIPQLLRRAHETLYNPTVKPRP